jgi:membrane-bound lytic murein transglycosylase D
MHKPWSVKGIVTLFFIYLGAAFAAAAPAPSPEAAAAAYLPDSTGIPSTLLGLMNSSRAKYLEGSNLIKVGETEKAQEAFNQAVDIVLQSSWDLPSTPTLHRFFQDLIQRIQQDESSYLFVSFEPDEEVENAVADELEGLDTIPITIDSELRDAMVADLAKTKYEIPITINEMVLKSLDFWLNRNRKVFEDGLVRSGQYRPMIEKVFREESIPLDLMYLAQVESLFKTHALSKAKAKGIWQFGKGTAVRYGLKVTQDIDERSDPEKSTRAAARYLNDLYGMFKDWNLVLAAYNWGEGKVKRLIDSTGMNDFWQLADSKKRMPMETKNHVPLIQASVILGRNPEKYGLPTQLDPPLQYTEVSVSKPIDLRAAAKVLSTSIDELKKLNPSLRGLTTPANYPNFQLKVPLDSAPEVQEKLESLPAAKIRVVRAAGCQHKVRRGETLSGIARRYKIKVNDLRKANNMSSKSVLKTGARLVLPFCSEEDAEVAISKSPVRKSSTAAAKKSPATKSKAAKAKSSSAKRVKSAQSKTKGVRSRNATASVKHEKKSKGAFDQIAAK